MKNIWISALSKDEKKVQMAIARLDQYGLGANGHFWEEELKQNSWKAVKEHLAEYDLWMILSDDETLSKLPIRLGLSMTAAGIRNAKGPNFPIVIAHDGELPTSDKLPTLLKGAEIVDANSATLGVKITSAVHSASGGTAPEYRLDLHSLPQGLCFEMGPAEGEWAGALFGVKDSEPKVDLGAQAPGPLGTLPEKAVLEFPIKDIKLNLGDKDFAACALKNKIDKDSAYFVLVHGVPETIVFGPFPDQEEDQPEFYVIDFV